MKKGLVLIVTFCTLALNAQNFSNGSIDFIFKPDYPSLQIAIWVEDENGGYKRTIFLTNFIGREGGGNRTSDPDIDASGGNRLSALPIWAYKRGIIDNTFGIINYYPPSQTQPSYPDDIDAISGATPPAALQKITWLLSNLPYGNYKCWIEVNKSFNFNEYHRYNDHRGQPSVVWNTTINVKENPDDKIVLTYAGYGSYDGSNGVINPPDSTITTATDLLSDMGGCKFKVVYVPVGVTAIENNYVHPLQKQLFILTQNYPNPFNSSAIISYSIFKSDLVTLKIYNMRGEIVQTLVNKHHEIGDYTINLNTNTLSNGIYFYKLQLGNDFVDTKMMMILH